MPPDPCSHPPDRVEWRKWIPSLGGPVRFRLQCLECFAGLGPKDTRPLDLPDGVDPSRLVLAAIDVAAIRKKRGRTGLGGKGNSRARELDRFRASPKWRGRGGIRDQVLIRDGNLCVDCGARATDVAHIEYPDDPWTTRAEHCKASCSECNQRERQERIAFGRRGRVSKH